jgi:hypothetical protein
VITSGNSAALNRDNPQPEFLALLEAGLATAKEHTRAVVLDLFWKALWAVFAVGGFWIVTVWIISVVGSTPYEGPDLDQVGPIVWIGVAAQAWQAHAFMVVATIVLFAITCAGVWLILEALFRGGSRQFWVYFATGTARAAALAGVAALLGAMIIPDRSAGIALISVLIFTAVWFLVITAETLVRRDAVELLGTNLGILMLTSGCFFIAELVSAILLWGLAAAALLFSSTGAQFLFALMVIALVTLIWTIFHSLLVAVRFSTIDLMRRNAGDE